jgi:hypothetical protein
VQELAAALTTVLNLNPDEAAIMGKAAQTLSTNFSWPKVAAEHYTVLQDAVTNYDAAQN